LLCYMVTALSNMTRHAAMARLGPEAAVSK